MARVGRLVTIAVLLSLGLVVSFTWKQDYLAQKFVTPQQVESERVLFRVHSSNRAGLGSLVAQLHSAIMMAEVLDTHLHIIKTPSAHGYDIADLFNGPHDRHRRFSGEVCSIAHMYGYENIHVFQDMMWRWCKTKQLDEHMLWLRGLVENCTSLIDDRPWHMDARMFSCTWDWLRKRLNPSTKRIAARPLSVGLHVRWG